MLENPTLPVNPPLRAILMRTQKERSLLQRPIQVTGRMTRRHFEAHQGCPLITGPEGAGIVEENFRGGASLQDSPALHTRLVDPCCSTGLWQPHCNPPSCVWWVGVVRGHECLYQDIGGAAVSTSQPEGHQAGRATRQVGPPA